MTYSAVIPVAVNLQYEPIKIRIYEYIIKEEVSYLLGTSRVLDDGRRPPRAVASSSHFHYVAPHICPNFLLARGKFGVHSLCPRIRGLLTLLVFYLPTEESKFEIKHDGYHSREGNSHSLWIQKAQLTLEIPDQGYRDRNGSDPEEQGNSIPSRYGLASF